MEIYPRVEGYTLIAVTWDNCDLGATASRAILDRAAMMGEAALVRRYRFSEYGDTHMALYEKAR
jgi:hypothetical protein